MPMCVPAARMLFFAGKVAISRSAILRQASKAALSPVYSIVGYQADKIVLVRPDVPIGVGEQAEPLPRGVGAKVSVGLLALDQFGGGAIQFLRKRRSPE